MRKVLRRVVVVGRIDHAMHAATASYVAIAAVDRTIIVIVVVFVVVVLLLA